MKPNKLILIVERSTIICKGLKEILLKAIPGIRVNDIDIYENICDRIETDKPKAIILNSILLTSIGNEKFKEILNCCKSNQVAILGLIHSYFDNAIVKQFDAIISINDSIKTVVGTVNRELAKDRKSSQDHFNIDISQREEEVIRYIALGFSNKEIADKMYISTHTVISHRKNITRKLGVKSTSAITIYAVINKIIDENDFNVTV